MLTPENYEQFTSEYEHLKQIVVDAEFSVHQFLHELNNKTYIGRKYMDFFLRISDGDMKQAKEAVKDFVKVIWNVEIGYK